MQGEPRPFQASAEVIRPDGESARVAIDAGDLVVAWRGDVATLTLELPIGTVRITLPRAAARRVGATLNARR